MSLFPPPVRSGSASKLKTRVRVFAACVTVIGIAALLAVVTGFPLSRGLRSGASRTASPGPTPAATHAPLLSVDSHMTAISMVSPAEGWTAGYDGQDGPVRLLHFHLGAWSAVAAPQVPILPRALTMVSATDGWMGGGASNDGNNAAGVMLHYNGGAWTPFPLPAGAGAINSIAMVSASEGWAVDATPDGGHAHILHYLGGVWSIAKTMPDHELLQSVSMVNAADGWVAGRGSYNPGLAGTPGALWHYANGAWQRVTPTDRFHSDVEYVAMLSSGAGWGIGTYQAAQSLPNQDYIPQGVALWRYSAGRWQMVPLAMGSDASGTASAGAIYADSSGGVWVGGSDDVGPTVFHCPSLSGCEGVSTKPIVAESIAMDSATDGWAVGDGAQLLHYFDGAWMPTPV